MEEIHSHVVNLTKARVLNVELIQDILIYDVVLKFWDSMSKHSQL